MAQQESVERSLGTTDEVGPGPLGFLKDMSPQEWAGVTIVGALGVGFLALIVKACFFPSGISGDK